jgi:adenylate cyclase
VATIRVEGTGQTVEASPAVSVLNALLRGGVDIRHDCGGKAICGTCRIRVAEGSQGLSPRSARETDRLAAAGAAPDERLACQTYCARNAEISIREGTRR